jgi:outer membrane protein OmpA-like peptidoglycan-associated protein
MGQPGRPENAPPIAPGVRDVTPPRPGAEGMRPGGAMSPPPPVGAPAGAAPNTHPSANAPGAGIPEDFRNQRRGPPPGLPAGTPSAPPRPTVTAPIPAIMPSQAATPLPADGRMPGARRLEDFRAQRQQSVEGGRTIIREPGRIIVQDPGGQSFIRHDEIDRFRFGARDVQVLHEGNDTRTVVVRPDGTEIITVNGPDGRLLRRIRRDRGGREIIIIDNSYRDPGVGGSFFVDLPPPVLRIPPERYIVDAEGAPPELIYDTLTAPPVEQIERRYSLDEIRYSPSVRQRMPSIDLDTINFETGSADIAPDQASKLQAIADGLNRAISRNPREVFLIEGHTDAVGNDIDNLSLSDRRAESAANLLTQQFQVPAENLTSQGYGEQYLKIPTDGPERQNRRVTIRRITPLLTGQATSLPPPPPGTEPPR